MIQNYLYLFLSLCIRSLKTNKGRTLLNARLFPCLHAKNKVGLEHLLWLQGSADDATMLQKYASRLLSKSYFVIFQFSFTLFFLYFQSTYAFESSNSLNERFHRKQTMSAHLLIFFHALFEQVEIIVEIVSGRDFDIGGCLGSFFTQEVCGGLCVFVLNYQISSTYQIIEFTFYF